MQLLVIHHVDHRPTAAGQKERVIFNQLLPAFSALIVVSLELGTEIGRVEVGPDREPGGKIDGIIETGRTVNFTRLGCVVLISHDFVEGWVEVTSLCTGREGMRTLALRRHEYRFVVFGIQYIQGAYQFFAPKTIFGYAD